MVNIGLVEIKSKVVREMNYNSPTSFGVMGFVTNSSFASKGTVKTDAKVVTDKINNGNYIIDTAYTIIYLYDPIGDNFSSRFISSYGGKLHNASSANITILTYFDGSEPNKWINVQQRDKIGNDPDCSPLRALEIMEEIKELYGVQKLPSMIIIKKDKQGNEQSFNLDVSQYNIMEELYKSFREIMDTINDNCEDEFTVIEGKICGSRSKITMKNNMSIMNTHNFIKKLMSDNDYTEPMLAGELDIADRTLRYKMTNNTFSRNECLYIAVRFGVPIPRLNELLRENGHLDLGHDRRDMIIRLALMNGYDISDVNNDLKEKGFPKLPK